MDASFELSGYAVGEPIDSGGAGELWQATELATDEAVVLERLPGISGAMVERLRREAAMVAAAAGPCVVEVRAVIETDEGAVVVREPATGGSLLAILAAGGPLSPPQLVTMLAPLASALAAAHTAGLVHGRLAPTSVVFGEDGRPLLSDFAVARVSRGQLGPLASAYRDPSAAIDAPPEPAGDVFSLAAVGWMALTGEPPAVDGMPVDAAAVPGLKPALAEAIGAALAPMAATRPDARGFASAVLRSCAAAPIRVLDPPVVRPPARPRPVTPPASSQPVSPVGIAPSRPPRPVVSTPTRRRRGRTAVLAASAVLAVAVAAATGVASARIGRHSAAALVPPRPAPTHRPRPVTSAPSAVHTSTLPPGNTGPAPSSWLTVVRRLDARRARAYRIARPSLLDAVYLPGAGATDQSAVRAMVRRGLRAPGFTATVDRVAAITTRHSAATLRVVDRLSGYRLVDASGRVVRRGRGRKPRAFRMLLRRRHGTWLVARVSPVGHGTSVRRSSAAWRRGRRS